ncbi:hypothetical protein LguiA_017192 [Lonicera macranthoides]
MPNNRSYIINTNIKSYTIKCPISDLILSIPISAKYKRDFKITAINGVDLQASTASLLIDGNLAAGRGEGGGGQP